MNRLDLRLNKCAYEEWSSNAYQSMKEIEAKLRMCDIVFPPLSSYVPYFPIISTTSTNSDEETSKIVENLRSEIADTKNRFATWLMNLEAKVNFGTKELSNLKETNSNLRTEQLLINKTLLDSSNKLNAKFENLEKTVEENGGKFDDLKKSVETELEENGEKFENLKETVEENGEKFDDLKGTVEEYRENFENLTETVREELQNIYQKIGQLEENSNLAINRSMANSRKIKEKTDEIDHSIHTLQKANQDEIVLFKTFVELRDLLEKNRKKYTEIFKTTLLAGRDLEKEVEAETEYSQET